MSKEVTFTLQRDTKPTEAQIAMIEAARNLPEEFDEDSPYTDPTETPERYADLMQAVALRNQRIARLQRERA